MSETNELSSYLVKLGFSVDKGEQKKFESALADAGEQVYRHTKSIVKDLAGWQIAITGGFAAIGTATLGLADKVSQSDLGFQLLGTQMFMSASAAKSLKIATDALGYSLDEIAWNPELHARYVQLQEDQAKLSASMGGDYEGSMRGLRDIRFEFTRMQVEGEYLIANVISQVFKGLGGGDVIERLSHLNDWVIQHMPEITSFFSDKLIPILKDGEGVLGDLVGMAKDLGLTFTNLIGLLSGDKSIQGTEFDFQKLGGAIKHVSNGMAEFVGWIEQAEHMLVHLADAGVLMLSGNFKGAASELKKALADLTPGSGGIAGGAAGAGVGGGVGAVAGGIVGGVVGSVIPGAGTIAGAAMGTTIGGGIGTLVGGAEGAQFGIAAGEARKYLSPGAPEHGVGSLAVPFQPTAATTAAGGDIHSIIDQVAASMSVDRMLAHAVAKAESGERMLDHGKLIKSGKGPNGGAKGVFQLEDATAAQYGVNSADTTGNIKGGINLLSDLLKKYGDRDKALAAYNWGQGHLDRAIKKHGGFSTSYLPAPTRDYIRDINSDIARQGGGVQVGTVIVNIEHKNPDHNQIVKSVSEALSQTARRQTQTNIATLGSAYQ